MYSVAFLIHAQSGELAVNQDVEQILEHAVERLPSAYRPVFRLREMEDLTTAETGERLGLSDACGKIRLFRAKNILRRTLRPLQRRGPVMSAAQPRDLGPGPQTAESQI